MINIIGYGGVAGDEGSARPKGTNHRKGDPKRSTEHREPQFQKKRNIFFDLLVFIG